MNPTAAPSKSIWPQPHEHVVLANILLLLALPLAAYLAHLIAIADTMEVNLPGEGLRSLLAWIGLSFGALLAWRRVTGVARRRARVERARAALGRFGASTARTLRARPRAAIWAVALAGVLLSCYPVVFGGKSFVSPNVVAQLFYGTMPSMPHLLSDRFEDTHGSDAGAMMWQNMPYTVIEHRALFRDHELPVWNRYGSGGVTLIGQGLSMIGDPLNAGVVLTGGSAWAWDGKFLAARLLFAAGIGLCVRAATGRLGAALVLAFGACFLGFFTYRFNHPANFALCYAPWILFPWLRMVRGGAVGGAGGQVRWVGLLLLACWMELNSGVVKETAMLLVFLNGAGLLILLLDDRRSWRWKGLALAGLAWAGAGFLLVSAPLWRTLLEAIAHSWNNYEHAPVWQLQPGLLIGLFDDIFYRQYNVDERMFDPTASFCVLLGLAWAVASGRVLARRHRVFLALGLTTLVPFALVFGVVSPNWVRALPFLGKLMHVDNTFSCVLLVPLTVLAGFGLERCRERLGAREWAWDYAAAAAVPVVLLALYLGTTQAGQRSDFTPISLETNGLPLSAFFRGDVAVLLASLLALPWLARWWHRQGMSASPGVVPWVVVCLGALLWRGGLHERGIVGWDRYVVHAGPRQDVRVESPGVTRLQEANREEPGRVLGFDNTLASGYAATFGLETPSSPDALQNPYFHDLLAASPVRYRWGWLWITDRRATAMPTVRRVYDLLNVRYYADRPTSAAPADVPGLRTMGRCGDLDLYESPTAWPRAFFTDALYPSGGASEFLHEVCNGDGRPFAAVSPADLRARPDVADFLPLLRGPGVDASHTVIAATGYRLTSRTTSFHFHASGPGVVVLSEGYQRPYNAQVYLDGKPVPHLRANEAFMGVRVPGAGEHDVRVVYGPRDLPLLLGVSGLGLVLMGGTAWRVTRGGRDPAGAVKNGAAPDHLPLATRREAVAPEPARQPAAAGHS